MLTRVLHKLRGLRRSSKIPAGIGFKRFLSAAGILFVITILFSCPTTPEKKSTKAPPLNEVLLKDIRDKIEKGMLVSSIQDISYLERESGEVSKTEIVSLYDNAVAKLQGLFNEKIKAKAYLDAYTIYRSLENIGKSALLPDWSRHKLFVQIADGFLSANNLGIALYYYLEAFHKSGLSDEEIKKASDLAFTTGNKSALASLVPEMEKRNIVFDESYKKIIETNPAITDFMKGTAVIWVDKGVKIEQGIGIPDIMLGSGFFIDKRGYLLTNHHVIASEVDPEYEGFSRLYIKLPSNTNEKVPAKVIGYDRIFDVALLKAEVTPQFVFTFEGPVPIEVGEKVIAIGAPLGLENTVTSGILSNMSRRFIQIGDVLQIDAPVNPGNSGGPLLDAKNNLLGIVFAGLEKFEGLNFAIPFTFVSRILPRLYEGGEVTHSWLGMSLSEGEEGTEIEYAVPEEPAFEGGLREGDILVSINGNQVKTIKDAQAVLLKIRHDTLVNLSWKRGEKSLDGVFATSKRPFSPIETALKRDSRNNVFLPLFGLKIEPVSNILWETDYVITKVIQGSIAYDSGLSLNDTLNIQNWLVENKIRAAFLQIFIKKRKAGYFESMLQLAAYLESENFL